MLCVAGRINSDALAVAADNADAAFHSLNESLETVANVLVLLSLSVYLQGQNLTNEPFVTINPGAPLEVIDYQRYGRRYQAGITYKF